MMKKCFLIFAMISLCALIWCAAAMGETQGMTITMNGPVELMENQTEFCLVTKINKSNSGDIYYSLTDQKNKTVVYTESRSGVWAGREVSWLIPYDDTGLTREKPVKEMRASFLLDGKTYTFSVFYTLTEKNGVRLITAEKGTWYPNNTACSFGPAFRDVKPSLTEKWYLFTPINLSIQGRQEFEYIASNMYVIGKVYVDVYGDSVTVSYHNFYADQGGNTETKEEFFTFFHDLKAVREVEPENLGDSHFRFGVPFSIERDLEGDTSVLLFVRNRVTYRDYVVNNHKLTRFWPNLQERKQLREQMMLHMYD